MPATSIRLPFQPAVLITLLSTAILLTVVYLIAPEAAQKAILVVAAMMIVLLAFTSMELTLYLLILATLLGPEAILGGAVSGKTTTETRGITLRLEDILLLLICLTWFFRMALAKELGRFRTPINQPVMWYMAASVLSTILGVAAGRVNIYGFFFVLKYFQYFVLFYMIVGHVRDEASIKRYLAVMVFTCFVASLFGIAQIPGGGRVSAPFEGDVLEPNTFGGYLLMMFSVVLGILLHIQKGRVQLMLILMIPIILVTLAFTESRSSYLGISAAVILFFIFSEKKVVLMIGALLGLAIFPIIIPQKVIDRVFYTFTQERQAGQIEVGGVHIDTSTSDRINAWKRAVNRNFFEHPVLGAGVTGAGFVDAQYPRILSETGLFGFLAFVWLMHRMWVALRQSYRSLSDPILRGAALGTLCGFGGLMVHAIGTNTFIIVRIMEPFMILMALVLASFMLRQAGETPNA